MEKNISPPQLLVRLTVYFLALIGGSASLIAYSPDSLLWLPLGGNDALESVQAEPDTIASSLDIEIDTEAEATSRAPDRPSGIVRERTLALSYLAISLLLTIVIMLPITWTYMATRHDAGFRKSFVWSLIILPLCATTIVLLIQNSLALAFGLAALVAAIRFRVALQDPVDGIYIFSAICVALAAGIGYLGIAAIMAIFFCYASTLMWALEYGRNAKDDKRAARERAKLDRPVEPQ